MHPDPSSTVKIIFESFLTRLSTTNPQISTRRTTRGVSSDAAWTLTPPPLRRSSYISLANPSSSPCTNSPSEFSTESSTTAISRPSNTSRTKHFVTHQNCCPSPNRRASPRVILFLSGSADVSSPLASSNSSSAVMRAPSPSRAVPRVPDCRLFQPVEIAKALRGPGPRPEHGAGAWRRTRRAPRAKTPMRGMPRRRARAVARRSRRA